jgi:hypothetical protein
MIPQGMAGRTGPRPSLPMLPQSWPGWRRLDMLVRLLEMAQMEAEERVRLRGKRSLS